jgi:hypothetical protein
MVVSNSFMSPLGIVLDIPELSNLGCGFTSWFDYRYIFAPLHTVIFRGSCRFSYYLVECRSPHRNHRLQVVSFISEKG